MFPSDQFALFITLCWDLWRCRCAIVFGEEHRELAPSQTRAQAVLYDYVLVMESSRVISPVAQLRNSSWTKPVRAAIKINVDADIDEVRGRMAVTAVARDSAGVVRGVLVSIVGGTHGC